MGGLDPTATFQALVVSACQCVVFTPFKIFFDIALIEQHLRIGITSHLDIRQVPTFTPYIDRLDTDSQPFRELFAREIALHDLKEGFN